MTIVILRGISGSGKTYLAKQIKTHVEANGKRCACLSSDDYFTDADGVYTFDASKLAQSHGHCLRRYIDHVSGCVDILPVDVVVVDNTATRALEAAPYYAIAEAYDAACGVVSMECSLGIAIDSNVHNTPREVIERQIERMREESIPPWWTHDRYGSRSRCASEIDVEALLKRIEIAKR